MASLAETRGRVVESVKPKALKAMDVVAGVSWPVQEAIGIAQEAFAPYYEATRDRIMSVPGMHRVEERVQTAWRRIHNNEVFLTQVFPKQSSEAPPTALPPTE